LSTDTDVIDALIGVAPGSRIDLLRRQRPETREQSQASYDALFTPVDDSEVSVIERRLVAAFATRLAADEATAEFYSAQAREADAALAAVVHREANAASTTGPFGHYAESGLQTENTDGVRYRAGDATRAELGPRLTSALEHAHLLVFRPREADGDAIQALLDGGWSTDGIVTLSQLVAFLSFQQRVVSGLRVLSEEVAA
jgi:CMD domain protein